MELLEYPFEAEKILAKRNSIRKSLKECDTIRIPIRIAIIGGSSTRDIQEILELFILNYGMTPIFYEGGYNRFYEEIMFENNKLKSFQPDFIYIHTTNRNVLSYPEIVDSEVCVNRKLEEEYVRYESIWNEIEKKYKCTIIQNNFEMPMERTLGNIDAIDIHGKTNFLSRLNEKFYCYAKEHNNFYICDINYLSADYGLSRWGEQKYYYLYKYALNVKAIPYLAYNIANIIKAIMGKNKKCIVLDLDGTLWGGVIGEDGEDNIVIGNETAEGEMYLDLQRYLFELKQAGILLAVNSKNDLGIALLGLNKKEMLLHKEDFAIIKANFNSKDKNILAIAEELQILPDSMIFIDDNPAELFMVHEAIEGISTVSAEKPETVILSIDRAGFFEAVRVTEDDKNRAEMYKKDQARKQLQSKFDNYLEYLNSLEMVADISAFTQDAITRITQLINKSNQFNLTTRRYTQSEIEVVAENENYITIYGRLRDKFGDNGIVSVIIAKREEKNYKIELWLMSCRVIKRNMEFAMFDALAEIAEKKGADSLIGVYIPTKKNQIVKDLYKELGFELIKQNLDDSTEWGLKLSNVNEKKCNCISVHYAEPKRMIRGN